MAMLNNQMVYEHIWNYPQIILNNDVQIFVPSKNRLITIWKFREFLHLWSRNFDLPILVSSRCEGHLQQFPGVGVVVDDLSGRQKLADSMGMTIPVCPDQNHGPKKSWF